MKTILVWLRNDLRLDDNPALQAACCSGAQVLPVYVLEEAGAWPPGAAVRWWLHHSLARLGEALAEHSLPLVLLRGEAPAELGRLAAGCGASAVYWNRRYEPEGVACDSRVQEALGAAGLETKCCAGNVLHEPDEVKNRSGGSWQVFTPFWRHCLSLPWSQPQPFAAPVAQQVPLSGTRRGLPLEALELLPRLGWAGGFATRWQPGEAGALERLARFVAGPVDHYEQQRDFPAVEGGSGLSPHLRFGEISVRRIRAALAERGRSTGVFPASKGEAVFLSELGWREFAYHLLQHHPETPARPLRKNFEAFAWARDEQGALLRAWQRGRTGYPIVDAGMRELWATGWMHNRVRMIAGSFLVKHLRLPWQAGAAWFWDTLVDADLASNTLGWQWVAGCGADAAPYFRIFNPLLQGQKFDADGTYIRRWVPELGRLPDKFLNAPWTAPTSLLEYAGVRLGENYPRPVVDHAQARAAALAAFAAL